MVEPEEIAVALRYEKGSDTLPQVSAKGRGAIARQILAVAEEHGVPIRRDADLVTILKELEPGNAIPVPAFAAVAEILALLYRTNATANADATAQRRDTSQPASSGKTQP